MGLSPRLGFVCAGVVPGTLFYVLFVRFRSSHLCSNTNGKYQEQESAPLVREFLADTGMTAAQIERVAYLVGHH